MGSNVAPKIFVLDVDGVLTTGQFFYSTEGKVLKVFGADDNDALSLLKPFMEIRFISGDKRGFSISEKRIVEDMGYPLDLVSTVDRKDWIAERYNLKDVIYMGDGIFDHFVMKDVGYSVSPSNGHPYSRECADYITSVAGASGAVAEACLHILEVFFEPFDINSRHKKAQKISGGFTV